MIRCLFVVIFLCIVFGTGAHTVDTTKSKSLLDSTTWCKLIKTNNQQLSEREIMRLINDQHGWRPIVELSLGDFTSNTELITRHQLPNDVFQNPSLYFTAYSGSGFSLYLNNTRIFSCLSAENISLRNYYVSKVVSLDSEYRNRNLYMWMPYKDIRNSGVFERFEIGSRDSMIDELVHNNFDFITRNILGMIMGVILLSAAVITFILYFNRFKIRRLWLLFFAIFLALAAVDINSEYIRVISNISPNLLTYFDFTIGALLPVVFLTFLKQLFFFRWKSAIGIALIVSVVFGIVLLVVPLNMVIINGYWVLNLVYVLLSTEELLRRGLFKLRRYRFIVWGIFCLQLSVVVEFVVSVLLSKQTMFPPFVIGLLLLVLLYGMYVLDQYTRERACFRASQLELETARNKLLMLERETIISQYEALKNQINPHFLFNCLNSLNSLIRTDSRKAILFVEEFSDIYRYVLDVRDKTTVSLQQELRFIKSYLFLQQIRYGDNLELSVYISDEATQCMIPPLSLQLLVENAIKHNEISQQKPLRIQIYEDNMYVVVQNSLQVIFSGVESKGIGLRNLTMRYEQLCDRKPQFCEEQGFYVARLPLLCNGDE